MKRMKVNSICCLYRSLGLVLLVLALTVVASAKGKKFGLFVGINAYPTAEDRLYGCVNDAKKMQSTLVAKYGFASANTTLLTDHAATRDAIIRKIKMYEQLAGPGDLFLFHYSGHGTLFPDEYSAVHDETKLTYVEGIDRDTGKIQVFYPRDKYDSALVPVDADESTSGKPWRNLILDDELYALFSAFTKKGVQVVFVSDSCHSGSIAKAPKSLSKVRALPLARVFGVKSFGELKFSRPTENGNAADLVPAKGMYIALTGARDDEFALDSSSAPVPMGLFTATLVSTLSSKTAARLTYAQLMAAVSPKVARVARTRQNDQNPQLDSRFGDPDAKILMLPVAVSKSTK